MIDFDKYLTYARIVSWKYCTFARQSGWNVLSTLRDKRDI